MRFSTMWYVKLLTEHHLEFQSLKGGCTVSFESMYTCQNTTLLEITWYGSFLSALKKVFVFKQKV